MAFIGKIKGKCESIYTQNYIKHFNNNARKKLTNKDFSIIAPNCIGGVLYHRLGLEFKSPTVNLFFGSNKDYMRFISNLKHYLSLDLKFIERERNYPTGMLDDVKIVFNHYKTEEQAEEKWNQRKQRVNYDNLFIIMDDRYVSYDDIKKFGEIPCKGRVCFSAKAYPEFNYVLPIKKYAGEERVGIYMLEKNMLTYKYPFDDDFDFVNWLNTGKI